MARRQRVPCQCVVMVRCSEGMEGCVEAERVVEGYRGGFGQVVSMRFSTVSVFLCRFRFGRFWFGGFGDTQALTRKGMKEKHSRALSAHHATSVLSRLRSEVARRLEGGNSVTKAYSGAKQTRTLPGASKVEQGDAALPHSFQTTYIQTLRKTLSPRSSCFQLCSLLSGLHVGSSSHMHFVRFCVFELWNGELSESEQRIEDGVAPLFHAGR